MLHISEFPRADAYAAVLTFALRRESAALVAHAESQSFYEGVSSGARSDAVGDRRSSGRGSWPRSGRD